MTTLVVDSCHTECGGCGYGRGGWASSPALSGGPILGPDSTVCPGCGREFDERYWVYGEPLDVDDHAIIEHDQTQLS